MIKVLLSAILIVLIAVGGFFAYALSPDAIEAVERPDPASFDRALVARGAELAALGNCLTCHQSEGGEPYGGGYAVETPYGAIYGSNITPDVETGIGGWSEAAFVRSMREGLDREGNHLYPAFPYTHYTIVTDDDVRAIYAYLMTRRPVSREIAEPDLPFPLNLRPLLAGWKLLFFEEGETMTATSTPDVAERGRYLVDGLGHCGACHTPRNLLMAERSDAYLEGAHAAGWYNPSLVGATEAPTAWTAEEIETYLTGEFAANHGVAAGPMAEVAGELRKAPNEDVAAIADYLIALQTGPQDGETQTASASSEQANELGGTLYRSACASCHEGSTGEAPNAGSSHGLPLALSTALHSPNGTNMAQFILHGVQPPQGETGWPMPGFADLLTDEQIVAIADYLRTDLAGLPVWEDFAETVSDARESRAASASANTNGS